MLNLSPLSSEERDLALRLASENDAVRRFLGQRFRAVLAEPTTLDRKQPDDCRQAAVAFYDYTTNRSLVAVVDLRSEEVLAVDDARVQFQLDSEEQKEAEELAFEDDRAREFLRDRDMNPLTRLFFPPKAATHDPPHRYAIVFLRPNDNERRFAVVDLSDREVVDFFDSEAITAQ